MTTVYVAARFTNIITNDLMDIIRRVKRGEPFELLDRKRMKIMAAFDLGQRWTDLANGPMLFIKEDDGTMRCPILEALQGAQNPDIVIKTEVKSATN